MVNYYPKPLEALQSEIYDTNPALYVGLPSRVGRFPLEVADPWNVDYVHFSVMLKQAKMRMGDQPGWDAVPELAAPANAFRKAKWFYWNMEITEKQLKSLETNPQGMIAQQIRATMRAQQDYFAAQIDDYLAGVLATANPVTSEDYDPHWRGLLHVKAASGTVDDPQDLAAAPGTATVTGIKLSGAAADVDPVSKSVGLQLERFFQQYDSNTKQAMYRANNSFDMFLHPAVIMKYKNASILTSTGERVGKVYDEITNLGINIIPSFAIDAAYDGATTTAAEHWLTMNTSENFMINEMVPYTVEGWKEIPTANGSVWKMRAYWKILPMIKPYYLAGVYKKALVPFTAIPYNA